MENKLRLCVAQMTSTDHHSGNIEWVQDAVGHAAEGGCDCLVLPEVAGLMNKNAEQIRPYLSDESSDPYISACKQLAAASDIWVHTGSTPIKGETGKFLNHSNLIDNTGVVQSRYDKIHLFDAHLKGQLPIGESSRYDPGAQAVLADTPWGLWGMSVCYDLRFPHLYRDYARSGATVLFIPSAFTVSTGEAHWEVLLRARAIETGCFVVAAAQVGLHADGRKTWGHSLVVDPWGNVLLDMGGVESGLAIVDLDIDQVAHVREQIPSLANERDYLPPVGIGPD